MLENYRTGKYFWDTVGKHLVGSYIFGMYFVVKRLVGTYTFGMYFVEKHLVGTLIFGMYMVEKTFDQNVFCRTNMSN